MAEEKLLLHKKLINRLQNTCSKKECCSSEIYKKALTALDGDKQTASEIIELLIKDKYIDDLRYASAYAREKAHLTGWGSIKIRYMLSAKQISKDIINEALTEIDNDYAEDKLMKIVLQKYKSVKDDPQCRLKLLRHALGRGYGYEEVNDAVNKVMSAERE